MRKIEVIIGSTRPKRIGRQIAEWVVSAIPAADGLEFELVDLADWPLPNDEPGVPANHEYVHEHTKAWSRKVSAGDAYVFVTPQYNWGYPASLKNAIDHLHKEWLGKPAAIVSYGHRGGGKAAAQLRQVLDGLHMRPVETMPAITFNNEMLDEKGRLRNPERDFANYAETVKTALGELAAQLSNGDQSPRK